MLQQQRSWHRCDVIRRHANIIILHPIKTESSQPNSDAVTNFQNDEDGSGPANRG